VKPFDETIRVANVTYRTGIGALADSRLEVRANGDFTTFAASVGVDDSSRGKEAAVTFEVYGDGRLLAKSPVTGFNQPTRDLTADVRGIKIIELVARQLGADTGPVVVAWGNAALR
jgi:alpha-galactosidase